MDILSLVKTGAQVAAITENGSDMLSASGFGAWIYSITGSAPIVVELPGNRAKVVLTQEQNVLLRKWLDSQVVSALKKKEPSRVQYEIGPALTPWALKYMAPVLISLVALGFVTGYYIAKR